MRVANMRPANGTPEAALWQEADEAETFARRSADLDTDPVLGAYVRGLICKLAPEYCGEMRILVMTRPVLNATAAPNGYVEVYSGLMLRARTESELAYVLGHEISHFARDHSLEQWQRNKTRSNVTLAIQVGVSIVAVAAMAQVACARTKFDDATGILYASASGQREFAGSLRTDEGRAAFAQWLGQMLGEEAKGPLRVLESPDFRFMDHPMGHVSIINMASVRDLEARIGAPVDPLRFRGNVYVEGWEPWIENSWEARDLMLGFARATVFKPIVRCIATHVDPTTGEKDLDIVKALFDAYGHMNCGIYIHVTHGGGLSVGDAVTAPEPLS